MLHQNGVFNGHPPQSIFEVRGARKNFLLRQLKPGFDIVEDEGP
jgi:hypothetical protein